MKYMLFFMLALFSIPGYSAQTGRIFVTNESGNSITVIDSKTNKVETTFDIGKRPRGIGLSPDQKELYVVVSDENVIKVIDPQSLKVLRQFKAGSDPETFAVHPNGHIYISNEDDAKASVYDPATGKLIVAVPVGLEPEGVAVSPDGSKVVITSESSNLLQIISVPEHQIITNILVSARPRSAVFTHDGKLIYASAEIGGEIMKVDVASGKILAKAEVGGEKAKPKDVRLSKDEKALYVAGGRANKVFLLDADTMAIKKEIPVGKRVWGLAMNKDGTRIYTTDGVSNTVSVIDTGSNEVIATIPVGKMPWGVVIDD
jgi:PQQ-dependent catabolism-associated beta-propeller protein